MLSNESQMWAHTSFGLSLTPNCYIPTHPPLISHFEHNHLTLGQIVESFKIGQPLNNMRCGKKACQIQASNSQ